MLRRLVSPLLLLAGLVSGLPDVIVATLRPAAAAENLFVRGDATGDGELALEDALTLLDHFFLDAKAPPPCRDALDYDDNGLYTISDALGLLSYLFSPQGPEPPAPFPECGLDPTPGDGFDCAGPLDGCPAKDAGPAWQVSFTVEGRALDPGIFVARNEAMADRAFAERRYAMRPLTLSIPPEIDRGTVEIEATDDLVALHFADGTPLPLPASVAVEDLPLELLLEATGTGRALLTATSTLTNQFDVIRVRAGAFPGLAGRSLPAYPFFEWVRSFNEDEVVESAIDPGRHAERMGLPYDVYVVARKNPAEWVADPGLTDLTGDVETLFVKDESVRDNTVFPVGARLAAGDHVGRGYDLVYDFGRDGTLDPGDLIDGLGPVAGFYVVKDLSLPGPLEVTSVQYGGGFLLGQRTWYPIDLENLPPLPLVVISHGNGHFFTWYDYLQSHLASYGYIVMSHQNNTMPGVATAATTTHTNTEYFLGNLDKIEDGIFAGHVDSSRITWIGHSRGGEGVVIAYDRLFNGTVTPQNYSLEDIALVSSIAPSVFLGTSVTNPHSVNYHLIAGAADGDVTGGADCPICQFFRIPQSATGNVQVTYVQGADHNDFNCCGIMDGIGPNQIGEDEAQLLAKSYYLALIELYIRDNPAARDYFTRMYDGFRPSGIDPEVICATEFRPAVSPEVEVIDDYQDVDDDPEVSSSGGAVRFSVANVTERRLDDANNNFAWLEGDPMNGMTQASNPVTDGGQGVVFDWPFPALRFYELEIVEGLRDFSDNAFLSFRVCQGTRHPETLSLGGPLDFTVTLRDGAGTTSSINFGVYGQITTPYSRAGGWANEFTTVRIRLVDFENDYSGIDLTNIQALRFEFGSEFGSSRGRIGLDDIMLTPE